MRPPLASTTVFSLGKQLIARLKVEISQTIITSWNTRPIHEITPAFDQNIVDLIMEDDFEQALNKDSRESDEEPAD